MTSELAFIPSPRGDAAAGSHRSVRVPALGLVGGRSVVRPSGCADGSKAPVWRLHCGPFGRHDAMLLKACEHLYYDRRP